MRVFDGEVHVAYHQFTLETPGEIPTGVGAPFAGQANGLCGAQEPGMLEFVTGLHTGAVPVVVEVLDTEPPLDPAWQEVVEVSLHTGSPTMMLMGWAGESADELDLGTVGSWRVRFHVQDMQAGDQHDTRLRDEPPIDRYLLAIWPASPAPDAVLRQTSDQAAYWHRAHPQQVAPPPQPAQVPQPMPAHPAEPVSPPAAPAASPQQAPRPGTGEGGGPA